MVATNFFQAHWMQQNNTLAQLIDLGVVPLFLLLATRGRLGYQRASSSSDGVPSLNESDASTSGVK
jgi:hypothetical protein